jgi:transcriptional regulator with XRE-family HTH domain
MIKVKELAEAKGWNISRLSEASGVSYPQTLAIWHDRIRRIDASTLDRLAGALGVRAWQLYEGAPRYLSVYDRALDIVQRAWPEEPDIEHHDMAKFAELLFYYIFVPQMLEKLHARYYPAEPDDLCP